MKRSILATGLFCVLLFGGILAGYWDILNAEKLRIVRDRARHAIGEMADAVRGDDRPKPPAPSRTTADRARPEPAAGLKDTDPAVGKRPDGPASALLSGKPAPSSADAAAPVIGAVPAPAPPAGVPTGASGVEPAERQAGGQRPATAAEPVASTPLGNAGAAAPASAPATPGALVLPTFDILRVEPDGSTVLAGKAPANADVTLLDGDRDIGSQTANAAGEFVVVLADRLAVGDHQIRLRARTRDGRSVSSAEAAIVSVPERGREGELLAMVEAPDRSSRLISLPAPAPSEREAAGVPAAAPLTATAETNAAEAKAEPTPIPADVVPPTTEAQAATPRPTVATTEAAGISATARISGAGETAAAVVTPPPASSAVPAVEGGPAPAGDRSGDPAPLPPAAVAEADEAKAAARISGIGEIVVTAVTPPPASSVPSAVESGRTRPEATAGNPPVDPAALAVEAVEIENDTLYVAGRTALAGPVRVYVDNRFLAADTKPQGKRFIVTATALLETGDHVVRADAIGRNGAVVARAEVPFFRPEGRTMAAISPPGAAPQPVAGAGESTASRTPPATAPEAASSREASVPLPDRDLPAPSGASVGVESPASSSLAQGTPAVTEGAAAVPSSGFDAEGADPAAAAPLRDRMAAGEPLNDPAAGGAGVSPAPGTASSTPGASLPVPAAPDLGETALAVEAPVGAGSFSGAPPSGSAGAAPFPAIAPAGAGPAVAAVPVSPEDRMAMTEPVDAPRVNPAPGAGAMPLPGSAPGGAFPDAAPTPGAAAGSGSSAVSQTLSPIGGGTAAVGIAGVEPDANGAAGGGGPAALAPAPGGAEVPVLRQPALESVQSRVIIRRGDTLWRISRDTYGHGSRYSVIYLANGDQIRNPNRIYPGQVFRMPDGGAAAR